MITFIAEDDIVTRHLLQTLLTRWGYTVCTAEDGNRAVEMFQDLKPPAMVLLDWMMPGMAGPDVCRRLRQYHTPQDAYVIMLTALNRPEDIVEGFESGVDDYLAKPITPVELRGRLQVGCRLLSMERELIRARQSLTYEISHDELTGLLNRSAILKVLDENLDHSLREDVPLAIALVRFDGPSPSPGFEFESVLLGEAAESIAASAKGALKSVRSYDAVGRFDERTFMVVFPGVDKSGAMNLSMRLLAGLRRRGSMLPMAVNVGLATLEGASDASSESLVRTAEEALHRAITAGPNAIEFGTLLGGFILPSQIGDLSKRF